MCTETFLRLPEEKRNRFLEAAWEEFTRVSFADASINQIIRRAGIPRGSFYQYFSGKEDLFTYLQALSMKHFAAQYQEIVLLAKGDLFQTQMMCFDRFCRLDEYPDLIFSRCLQVLRLNPGILLQVAIDRPPIGCLLNSILGLVDASAFRSREPEFIKHVFTMSLMSLAFSVMDCMSAPDNTARYRQELSERLEIIKRGSLAAPCQEIA